MPQTEDRCPDGQNQNGSTPKYQKPHNLGTQFVTTVRAVIGHDYYPFSRELLVSAGSEVDEAAKLDALGKLNRLLGGDDE